tara:strand:+ start:144 stop:620 length:477 start_codon:yes stop_codon:yes gene_type:complete
MPKPKPDQVIRHEVVLGRSERDLISDGIAAYQFNRITTPLVALFSDASAMGLIFGGLATYYGFKFDIIPNAYDNSLDLYNDWKIQYDAWKETASEFRNDPIGEILELIFPNVSNPFSAGSNQYAGFGQPGQPYGPPATNPAPAYPGRPVPSGAGPQYP